jgi:hypothetical protein
MMQLNWEITVTHAYRDENFVDELVAMAFHLAAYYPQNFKCLFYDTYPEQVRERFNCDVIFLLLGLSSFSSIKKSVVTL